jgi:hypothetical protein
MSRKSRLALAISGVLLLLLLVVAPFLVPGRLYAPQLELAASEQLGERVQIGEARLLLLPFPRVVISDISIGRKPFVTVQRLKLTPRLLTLFSDQRVLRIVELEGVWVGQKAMSRLQRWTARSAASGPAQVVVERVVIRRAELRLDSVALRGADADVRLRPDGTLESALVHLDNQRLRLTLEPSGKDTQVLLAAENWRLPTGPGIVFTNLEARGTLDRFGLNLPVIQGRIYGGSLVGKAKLGWKREWTLSGEAEIKNVNVEPLAALYTRETAISGRLGAVSAFRSSAASAADLAGALMLEADFELQDGMLHKVDLAAATTLLPSKAEKKEGVTRFDRFSGHLTLGPGGIQFSGVEITSGVLEARGYVLIAPDRKLSGRVETAVKGTGSIVGTPLAISGTVDTPRVLPTKGTLAGAAAGTLLLGPGVGTTLGIKAGQLTERLFGKQPPQQPAAPAKPDKAAAGDAKTPPAEAATRPAGGR